MPELASWPSIGTPLFTDPPNGNTSPGDFTYAVPISIPEWDVPLKATTKPYIFRQWMMQYAKSRVALPLNTPYPNAASPFGNGTNSSFVLVEETQGQDAGGGIEKWQRVWAQVPDSFYEPETFNATLPGMENVSGVNVPVIQGRDPLPKTVESRTVYDYFICDPGGIAPPFYSGVILASDAAITINYALRVVTQFTYLGAVYGGFYLPQTFIDDFTMPTGRDLGQTVTGPSGVADVWNLMVQDAKNNSWNATVTNQVWAMNGTLLQLNTAATVWGGVIVAEDSRISRWMGNIFVRSTRYILAQ